MAKVKYVGKGLWSKGIQFDPVKNDGLYEVSDDTAKYLCETFSADFILIEPTTKPKATKKAQKTSKQSGKKSTEEEVEAEGTEAKDS